MFSKCAQTHLEQDLFTNKPYKPPAKFKQIFTRLVHILHKQGRDSFKFQISVPFFCWTRT